MKEFKYPGVLLMTELGIDSHWGYSAVVKRELSMKASNLQVDLCSYPHLQYVHTLWVVTKRIRSEIKAAEMSFHKAAFQRWSEELS